jgi:hypothetical protein
MSFDDFINNAGKASSLLGKNANQITNESFRGEGFTVSQSSESDTANLPSSKALSNRSDTPAKRSLMHWFVPEYGVVQMYMNPQRIQYSAKKIINKNQTKGGFSVTYWGEELMELTITGTTGSSGVEGLNVLYEVYRAEQLAFDPVALSLAAASNSAAANLLDQGIGSLLGENTVAGAFGEIGAGLLGSDSIANLLPDNTPSLAALATGVEMFFQGLVYRGYFTSMDFDESSDKLGLWDYSIRFTVTERRGYRTNTLPWQHSAVNGPSDNGVGGAPLTFGPQRAR